MDDYAEQQLRAAEAAMMALDFPDQDVLDSSDIVNHFVQCFKTVLIADINGFPIGRFENHTKDDTHAEDNLMASIYKNHDALVAKGILRTDGSAPNVLKVIINNSPCARCAEGLRELQAHTAIDFIEMEAANAYDKGRPVEGLEGTGVIVDWFDVEAALARQGVSLEDDVLATFPRLAGQVDKQKKLLAARRRKTSRTQDTF